MRVKIGVGKLQVTPYLFKFILMVLACDVGKKDCLFVYMWCGREG